MKRRLALHLGIAAVSLLKLMPAHAKTTRPKIEVFKSPTCGCCTGWVEHLRANAFDVTVNETVDPGDIRKRMGLPSRYASCHNGIVGGYIVEGHVPAAEVNRLLALKLKAVGLAVSGMPLGSPGMDMGDRREPYEVVMIDSAGRSAVFARYPKF